MCLRTTAAVTHTPETRDGKTATTAPASTLYSCRMASLTAEASAAAAAAAAAEDAGSSALEDEIAQSVMEGKGWKDGEREAYLKQVSEEDHPMFAENIEVRPQTVYSSTVGCVHKLEQYHTLCAALLYQTAAAAAAAAETSSPFHIPKSYGISISARQLHVGVACVACCMQHYSRRRTPSSTCGVWEGRQLLYM